MTRPILNRALRRALILSLSVPPLAAHVACGGDVVVDSGATGSGTTTGRGGGTTTAACVLLSQTPTTVLQGGCAETFEIAGAPAACGVMPGGALPQAKCQALCPLSTSMKPAQSCTVDGPATGAPGGATLNCIYLLCGTGRRPPGLAPFGEAPSIEGSPAIAPSEVARYLGRAAHLEAASVVAFERLAAELEAHGAPEGLVHAARRSARDEVRHARMTRRFAEQAGARPQPVVHEGPALRSLEAIAADNAVEGCVRETFGAVVAMRQAKAARDPELRRAMETIAGDEARHAELSWELARWIDGQLDAAARLRVGRARDFAVEGLLRELDAEPHPSLVAELGLPGRAQARAAAEALRATLWS